MEYRSKEEKTHEAHMDSSSGILPKPTRRKKPRQRQHGKKCPSFRHRKSTYQPYLRAWINRYAASKGQGSRQTVTHHSQHTNRISGNHSNKPTELCTTVNNRWLTRANQAIVMMPRDCYCCMLAIMSLEAVSRYICCWSSKSNHHLLHLQKSPKTFFLRECTYT